MSTVIDLDDRRRAPLGKIGRHTRYLVREEADGTIILEPAMVLTEAEVKLMGHPELLATIEDNRAHPERRRPRPPRPTS